MRKIFDGLDSNKNFVVSREEFAEVLTCSDNDGTRHTYIGHNYIGHIVI